MAPLSYLIWLSTRESIRADMAVGLLGHFGRAEAAYRADGPEYDLLQLPSRLRRSLLDKQIGRASCRERV